MSIKQEVYHSSTLGDIPLSFTGRRLMQNLREEINDFLRGADTVAGDDWKQLSIARGKLALYISKLERSQPKDITQVSDEILLAEIWRRFYAARGGDL